MTHRRALPPAGPGRRNAPRSSGASRCPPACRMRKRRPGARGVRHAAGDRRRRVRRGGRRREPAAAPGGPHRRRRRPAPGLLGAALPSRAGQRRGAARRRRALRRRRQRLRLREPAHDRGRADDDGRHRPRDRRQARLPDRLDEPAHHAVGSAPSCRAATGLLYTVDKPAGFPDAWNLAAIDWRTGEVRFRALAGEGLGFNSNGGAMVLGPDGAAYAGILRRRHAMGGPPVSLDVVKRRVVPSAVVRLSQVDRAGAGRRSAAPRRGAAGGGRAVLRLRRPVLAPSRCST